MKKSYSSLSRFTLVFLIVAMLSGQAFGQWYDPEKVDKKAKAIYESAYNAAMDGKYGESLDILENAIKIDPKFVEAYLSRAGIYADLRNYPGSVAEFEKGFALDPVFSSTYLLPFSISLAGTGQFEKALEKIKLFLQTPGLNEQSVRAASYRKATYEFAIAYAKEHPAGNYKFAPQNLGENINSDALEYYPSLTIDGKKMIFSRMMKNQDEDFYESNLVDGKWTKAVPVGGKINTNLNEGAQNISQDGELLIFTGCNYPEGQGSCDLYIAYKRKNGAWSEPENLGPIVNTDFWESSPSLSPDKQSLYFSSSQGGGYGGKDLWVTHRTAEGKWSRPKNLGPEVNTSADESCAFLHADNETLYFNSSGHMGYGLTDLFLTKKQEDGSWSKPLNLGYPINTIDDEGSLIVAADGKTSYYASDGSDSKGGLDLYTFQLRDEIRAAKTSWVKGKVFDEITKQGLPSSVELTDVDSRRVLTNIQTDEDGNYLVTLPEGKLYAFNVNRKGYLFFSDNFSLTKNSADSFFTVDIPLQPIKAGAAVVLRNIFFDVNKSELKPTSLMELDKVVGLLRENPNLKIQIGGHTDNIGTAADNLALSQSRAKAVTTYLISKGIDQKRVAYKGYGAGKPVADNSTEAGRSQNRRTEMQVTSN